MSFDGHMTSLLCDTCHDSFPSVQGHTPAPEPGVDSGALASASQLWEGLLQSGEPLELTVQSSSHASFGRVDRGDR